MNEYPLSSELHLETAGGEKANLRNLPAPVMQALYHQLTGKREKYLKYFNSDYIINKESIRDLVIKLEQTLEQFVVQGSNLTATIIHFNKDKQDCSSLEKFSQYDSSRSDPVSSITLRFDFLLTPPGAVEPQNYTIGVVVNSFILLKSDKFGSFGVGGRIRDNKNVIEVTIDYVDYVVSRSFQSTIEEWVESLEKNKIFRLPGIFRHLRFAITESLKNASSISLSYVIYTIYFGNSITVYSVFIGIATFFISRIFFDILVEWADDMAFPHAFFPFIVMNKGDERNLKKFVAKRKKYVGYGFAIFTGIAASIIASFAAEPLLRLVYR